MELPRRHRRSRNYCCVVGCHSNEESRTIKFFTFPWKKLPVRTELWRKAIKRENADGSEWFPHSRSTICANHFVSGQPSRTRAHPDYIPSIFPTNHAKAKTPADAERAQRVSNKVRPQVFEFKAKLCRTRPFPRTRARKQTEVRK
jgi:hypothetical protein